ncbi:MAG: acyl-CoA dehydrogenase [bacterium]|nr:acyl-CoA dehydrogenase [bacterium]
MSIDLAFDDAQEGIATALSQFCEESCNPETVKALTGKFPEALWRDLAQLGILAAGSEESEGGPCEIVAAMETLGFAAFPGPLAATFLATQLVDTKERVELAEGRTIVAVGRPPLLPFAKEASIFLEIEGEEIYRVRPLCEVECVQALGGEAWGRVECERIEHFEDSASALALYRIALSAYLVGVGDGLLRAAVSHAATRKQFGQPIGQFQAVAHPLADGHVRLEAARLLTRSAASRLEGDLDTASSEARAAHYSARRAAVEVAHSCHQVFGAIGITLEGPAFQFSRRIMQLAALAPPPEVTAEGLFRQTRLAAQTREERP